MNAEKLEYPDNTFDTYICNLCLMLANSAENVLSEAYRKLVTQKPKPKTQNQIYLVE